MTRRSSRLLSPALGPSPSDGWPGDSPPSDDSVVVVAPGLGSGGACGELSAVAALPFERALVAGDLVAVGLSCAVGLGAGAGTGGVGGAAGDGDGTSSTTAGFGVRGGSCCCCCASGGGGGGDGAGSSSSDCTSLRLVGVSSCSSALCKTLLASDAPETNASASSTAAGVPAVVRAPRGDAHGRCAGGGAAAGGRRLGGGASGIAGGGVYGEASEYDSATQIKEASVFKLSDTKAPIEPVTVTTKELQRKADGSEPYEGMLVTINGLTVVNANPDGPNKNYGDFVVTDSAGNEIQVRGDVYHAGKGLLDGDTPLGSTFESITGVVHYHYATYKIMMRDTNDFKGYKKAEVEKTTTSPRRTRGPTSPAP